MKIYKIAQYYDPHFDTLRETLKYVFGELSREFGVQAQWDRTYTLDASIEKHDPSAVEGEGWVQVSHSRNNMNNDGNGWKSYFHVEKYYDNEYIQDRFGKVQRVQFAFEDNAQDVMQRIKAAINNVENNT
jgi:hypothetical protein